MKWEYTTYEARLDYPKVTEDLARIVEEGWEMIHIFDGCLFIFKRPAYIQENVEVTPFSP